MKKVYKHNDYYGYINDIQSKAISNPEWFWSDDLKASEARQWLYDNDAEEIVDNIYENTPKDIQYKIDKNKLSLTKRSDRTKQQTSEGISNAGKKLAPVLAGAAVAPYVISTGAVALANPYVRTALDLIGTVDGVRNAFTENGVKKTIRLAKEGDVKGAVKSGIGDVLDLAGISDLARTVSLFNRSNRALHAFNTISPIGYDKPVERFKNWFDDIINERSVNIDHPKWNMDEAGRLVGDAALYGRSTQSADVAQKIAGEARFDAWRLYNGLPQKYGTYVKNADGTYAYDLERIKQLDPNFSPALENKYDDITGAGGGLTLDKLDVINKDGNTTKVVRTIEDVWDLHPFSRVNDKFSAKINTALKEKIGSQKFRDAAQSFRTYMYNKGHWGYKPKTLIGKMTHFLDSPLNQYRTGYRSNWTTLSDGSVVANPTPIAPTMDKIIDGITNNKVIKYFSDKLATLEAGKIIGGRPFTMHTEIPMTKTELPGIDPPEGLDIMQRFDWKIHNGPKTIIKMD